MKYYQWVIWVLFFIIINFSLLGVVNYLFDPFKIFNSNFIPYQVEMNERFVKVDYLKKNHDKFNSYIFGSSRVGTTDPQIIERYIPNSKFYNFSLSSANLYDYQKYLKFFIEKKYEINSLYLQLDIEDMSRYGQDEFNYAFKIHPEVSGSSKILFYIKYLFNFFPLNITSKIKSNTNKIKTKEYQLDKGTWRLDRNEASLVKNCKEYIANVYSFHFKNKRSHYYTTKKMSMKALREIVDLCHKNDIKLYLYTTPHNQNKMDTFVLDDYYKYLRDISKITSFYDFSGYNSVTKNNCNYYEMSHYRPYVAKLIAAKIFDDNNISVPSDFGKYIKKGSMNGQE